MDSSEHAPVADATGALGAALAQVPFLANLGVSVEEARPGVITLRLPAKEGNLNADGYLAGAALFAVGELAAVVACGTHPRLNEAEQSILSSRIRYFGTSSGAVTAHASLRTELVDAVRVQLSGAGQARAEMSVKILDGYGNDIAEVAVTMGIS